LEIKNLSVSRQGQTTLTGISLELAAGQLHVLMGPNGSGKSSLALALMGYPDCQVTAGQVKLNRRSLLKQSPDERSLAGLFLSPQTPPEIEGVGLASFLRSVVNQRRTRPLDAIAFQEELLAALEAVGLPDSFAERNLNQNFSGGEKKRAEVLQMLLLEPKFAILDEVESGLDVDGLKALAAGVDSARKKGAGVLLITHSDRMLKWLKPNRVHLLVGGRLLKSGGPKLAQEISEQGFRRYIANRRKR
jgi:Fe-S cluster assembly ATP-binding protein